MYGDQMSRVSEALFWMLAFLSGLVFLFLLDTKLTSGYLPAYVLIVIAGGATWASVVAARSRRQLRSARQ
jgi:4-amino-4-deoxy-L-arabinose transferase-like glycosyltransferase